MLDDVGHRDHVEWIALKAYDVRRVRVEPDVTKRAHGALTRVEPDHVEAELVGGGEEQTIPEADIQPAPAEFFSMLQDVRHDS